jgi:hypothetical protein
MDGSWRAPAPTGGKTAPMRKLLLLLLICAFSAAPPARGQDAPKYEIFAGGSYSREDINQIRFINGVGWHLSVTGNANSWLGVVFDFSGQYSSPHFTTQELFGVPSPLFINVNSSAYTFLFGPRFSYRRWAHLTPYAEGLVGLENIRFTSEDVGLTRPVSSNSIAVGLGGGIDVPLNRRFAIRLIEADYIPTRFREIVLDPVTLQPSFSGEKRTQENLRVSIGFVLRF